MIPINKILFIFEVLLISSSHDASTETKLQREHSGESPSVIFRHRLDVGSSDSLLLFYQNHSIMLPTNDDCGRTAQMAISAERIINDLVSTNEVSRMREHLRELIDSYLLNEDDKKSRQEIYGTFLALDYTLRKSESISKERRVA